MIRDSNHYRRRKFSYFWKIPDLSGYREAVSVGLKGPKRQADHLPPSTVVRKLRISEVINPFSKYAFMACRETLFDLYLYNNINCIISEVTHSFHLVELGNIESSFQILPYSLIIAVFSSHPVPLK